MHVFEVVSGLFGDSASEILKSMETSFVTVGKDEFGERSSWKLEEIVHFLFEVQLISDNFVNFIKGVLHIITI